MKAVWFEKPGEAGDVLIYGEREAPQPGKKEVLVRLYASAVNPSDVKKRAGQQPAGLEAGFVIPHSDGAGIIESVGEEVSAERIGERVWVYQAQYGRNAGTAAQYVAVPSDLAAALPENTDFQVGACIGIPIMTAHRCVFASGDVRGKTVLVTGASGRVGFYAVQWAKQAGARVIGTAGNEENCEIAKQAGADVAINYRSESLADDILSATDGKGVDRIVEVEFGRNIDISVQILKTGGVIATYSSSQDPTPVVPFYSMMFKNITVQTILVYNMDQSAKQAAIADIFDALKNSKLNHRIAEQYSLPDTAAAHRSIEKGSNNGCVVIEIE